MRVLLLLPLLLTACSNPGENGAGIPPVPPEVASGASGFDAQAWLAEARTTGGYHDAGSPEAARNLELLAELGPVLDWKRACYAYADRETGERVYDPPNNDFLDSIRGTLFETPLSPTEAIFAVTCYTGAYQGSYAFVHVHGDDAALLVASALGEDGLPTDEIQTAFSHPPENLSDGVFQIFSKSRGPGDCGTFVTYALAGTETLDIREVRYRECDASTNPDSLPPPSEWPVVYTAE